MSVGALPLAPIYLDNSLQCHLIPPIGYQNILQEVLIHTVLSRLPKLFGRRSQPRQLKTTYRHRTMLRLLRGIFFVMEGEIPHPQRSF